MNQRVLRVGAIAASAILAATLVSCSSGGAPADSDDAFDQPITGEIVVWDVRYPGGAAWGQIMDKANEEFIEQHPGVTIKEVEQPSDPGQYSAAIRAAIAAGSGPDVLSITQGYNGVLLYTDAMEPVSRYVSAETLDNLSGWEVMRPDFGADGDAYAVPIGLQGFTLIYNKELFAQAGLDPDNPPTSLEELLDAGKALKAAGILPLWGGNLEGYENGWWLSYLGGALMTSEQTGQMGLGELPADSPEMKEVFETYKEIYDTLYDQTYLATALGDAFGVENGAFNQGKAAMTMWLSSYLSEPTEALGDGNVGVIPGISVGGGSANYLTGSPDFAYAIPKFAKNKAAALAYIEYITGPEVQAQLMAEGVILPNNKAVDLGDGGPGGLATVDIGTAYATQPLFNGIHSLWPLPIEQEAERQLQLVLQGSASVDEALAAVKNAQDIANSSSD